MLPCCFRKIISHLVCVVDPRLRPLGGEAQRELGIPGAAYEDIRQGRYPRKLGIDACETEAVWRSLIYRICEFYIEPVKSHPQLVQC